MDAKVARFSCIGGVGHEDANCAGAKPDSANGAEGGPYSLGSERNWLCSVESQLEVLRFVLPIEGLVVEGLRVEAVDEGAEGHSIVPAGGEVFEDDVLFSQPTDAQR